MKVSQLRSAALNHSFFERYKEIVDRGAVSRQELDLRRRRRY
jgi:hypothetical protein